MVFARPDGRHSGIVVAVSALRSASSPACGEYPDLVLLGDLAASWGFDLLQLLPVNDTGGTSSPYMALSAFALHPLYLRIADLPEAASVGTQAGGATIQGSAAREAVAAAAGLAAAHADDERLDYGTYHTAKLAILEELFLATFGKTGCASKLEALPGYLEWEAENPWVRAYAVFSELKRRAGGAPWWEWKSNGEPGVTGVAKLWKSAGLEAGSRFFAWLQFRAAEQFRRACLALQARGVELLGDIPILIAKDSADVWSDPAIFRLDLSAGSPPDGDNPLGQNWGFPAYDWEELGCRDYDFWRQRLAAASQYYSAYRIDHVLGFFRIWTVSTRARSGWLGRFLPTLPIRLEELLAIGFDRGRIRWLAQPHLRLAALREAARGDGAALARATEVLLDRLGHEDLYLFKPGIRGELDLEEGLETAPDTLRDFMFASWRDRALLEYEEGRFVAASGFWESHAWASLSQDEKGRLEGLLSARRGESERLWEEEGRRVLSALASSTDMLATAEDLGGIPSFVPGVLEGLGILGLRVLRWTRAWEKPGQPYVPTAEWPRLSVTCPSVHDSSSLRAWWEREADRPLTWAFVEKALGREIGEAPVALGPREVGLLLETLARSASLVAVYPIQDLLCLSATWCVGDPVSERVNVPGSDNAWNWGYRLSSSLEEIAGDRDLRDAAGVLARAREAGVVTVGLRPGALHR
jgi:4-alpha-glucanotransferase